MPGWGTVLGSGYDAFFDRKDKNREFQLRKQQEDALNTLRQIQIEEALKKQKTAEAVKQGQLGLMQGINQPALDSPHGYPAPVGGMLQPTLDQRLGRFLQDDFIGAFPSALQYTAKDEAVEQRREAAKIRSEDLRYKTEEDNKTRQFLAALIAANRQRQGGGGGAAGDKYDDKLDYNLVKKAMDEMPKLLKDARQSAGKIVQYDELTKMIDSGAGGFEGGLKSAIAPVAEYLGVDSKKMSEAQAYQLMARAGAGGMRLALIGPGQVSNYEQELIQKLSGGSMKVSRAAARDLFAYYKNESKRTISNYNESLKNLTDVYPKAGMMYKPIEIGTTPTKEKEQTPSGAKPRFTIKKVK